MTNNHSKKRSWLILMILFLLFLIIGRTQIKNDISNEKLEESTGDMERDNINATAEDVITGEGWKKVYGGINSRVNFIKQTSDGGYIATGYIDYGQTRPTGINDTMIGNNEAVYLLKIDKDGNLVWDKVFGGVPMSACSGYNNIICELNKDKPSGWLTTTVGRSVQQTADGGYVIVGDYHTAKVTNDPNGFLWDKGDEVYLIKTDSEGNLLWKKMFDGEEKDENGYYIQQTSDRGYFIVGTTNSYGVSPYTLKELGQVAPKDIYLLKTDANGNIVWKKVFGGIFNDLAFSGQQTSDGGYIIVGITVSFGRNNTKNGLLDILSLPPVDDKNLNSREKLKQAGAEMIYGPDPMSIGDPRIPLQKLRYDMYLLKIDSEGNKVWEKTFGTKELNEIAYSVQQTSDGGFVLVGQTFWPLESYELLNAPACWPYEPCDNSTPPVKRSDVYLIKTDANGNKIWEKIFGGEAMETDPMYSVEKIGLKDDIGYSVRQTSDEGYIISGFTRSVVHKGEHYDSSSTYLVKTDSNGNKVWEKAFRGWGGANGFTSTVGGMTYAEQTSDGGYIIAAGDIITYEELSLGGDRRGHAYIIKTNEKGDT